MRGLKAEKKEIRKLTIISGSCADDTEAGDRVSGSKALSLSLRAAERVLRDCSFSSLLFLRCSTRVGEIWSSTCLTWDLLPWELGRG